MRFIDPHIHLFSQARGNYQWLAADNPPFWPQKAALRRDVSEHELNVPGMQGYVHIEAGFDNVRPWREVHWLQQHCRLPMRVIGSVALSSPHFSAQLSALATCGQVVGVRDILDDRAADLLRQPQVRHHLGCLADSNLVFEAQLAITDTAAVQQLAAVLQRYPRLQVVLNHAGGVADAASFSRQWQTAMRMLSRFKNLAVKVSGFEMCFRPLNWRELTRTTEFAVQHFGKERVMLASNFPLISWQYSYRRYWQQVAQQLPHAYRDAVVYDNAAHYYRFS
ncbi:amidohydrolase family protein [Alteromonas sp. ASW11-19]|uniref:Amidohydrolase family protein n=1 Tax=Alteromonas salexigens TaxID=2982530 RepID=A0ABT2VKT4_9ALTE|nr:amidohydrolase family protein [Alteromonas salexigens]MCU7553063.1 amidohydrolase family protein [Alteromonas salexigens]